jgi:hypothetical protein
MKTAVQILARTVTAKDWRGDKGAMGKLLSSLSLTADRFVDAFTVPPRGRK